MYDFEVFDVIVVIRWGISPSSVRVINVKEFILQAIGFQYE